MLPTVSSHRRVDAPERPADVGVSRWFSLSGLRQDIGQAVRILRRNPAASALAIGTMALGIGLETAMCSVLNGTVWHPLRFRDPHQLVALQGPVSSRILSDWSSAARSVAGMAGYRSKRYTLTGAGDAASLRATVASGSLFSVLDEAAAHGRTLSRADDNSGARPAVLADTAWRIFFDADPRILGKTIYLNRVPFVVVGVMPPGFQFPTNVHRVDLYTTIAADVQTDRRQAEETYPRDLQVVARLKPGVELSQARAEMEAIDAASARERGDRVTRKAGLLVPLAAEVAGPLVAPLTVLTGAVACVLVIACATVAILALIRVMNRRGELATRLALGATRGHLARQLLVESLLIALAGGAVGALLAFVIATPILVAGGPNVASVAKAQLDFRVVALSLLVGLAAAAAFGTIPSVQAASTRWPHSTGDAGRVAPRSTSSALRRLLVTSEIALAVALLVACITLLRAYLTLSHVDPGFNPANVLTFRIDLSDALYTPLQQVEFFERVRVETGALPGVESAAFTALLPFGDLRYTIRLDMPARGTDDARLTGVEVHLVSAGFFRAMGIPLIEGRDFTTADAMDRPRVAIVSQTLASRCFPGENPIGRAVNAHVGAPGATTPMPLVVGVVGDVRNGTLAAAAEPQLYVPYGQAPMLASTTFAARLSGRDPGPILTAIRQRVRALNPLIPIVDARPLAEYVHAWLLRPRFTMLLVSVFAASAVFLAMAGLYAVVSYSAVSRRREFSIRRALGATEQGIARLVVTLGLQVLGPGLAVGLAGALAINKLLESVLYGVRPSRPATIFLAAAVAVAVAMLATWQPARAAGRDDLRAMLQSDV